MQVLATRTDEWGTITVKEDAQYRVLAFADNDEQSRIMKAQPQLLQHEYTQAMLLVLLFKTPARVLILGLGGGCLATALHSYLKGVHITAVELRPAVIELATQYFQIPHGKKIKIIQQEASAFLQTGTERKVDIIFTDLYHAQGADQGQFHQTFIDNCLKNLKEDGYLVINAWTEHQATTTILSRLNKYFPDIRTVNTSSHNWIIIASRVPNYDPNQVLKQRAYELSKSLGYSLNTHLSRLNNESF